MHKARPILSASLLVAILTLGLAANSSSVQAQTSPPNISVERFATIPTGLPAHPEGMTADANGNIIVASFETPFPCPSTAALPPAAQVGIRNLFGAVTRGGDASSQAATTNYLYTFNPNGQLVTQTPFVPCDAPLGMQTIGSNLFVINVFNGTVVRYQLPLTATSTPAQTFQICGGFLAAYGLGGPDPNRYGFCALNDMKLGPDGRLYLSDNGAGPTAIGFPPGFLTGRIFVLNPSTGVSSLWFTDPGLNVNGTPEFGVVSNVFSPDGKTLYMSNFSSDFVYSVPVAPVNQSLPPSLSNPLAPPTGPLNVVYKNSSVLTGPNHLAFDPQGRLWATGGENNTVVGLDVFSRTNGQATVVATAGTFCGFSSDGAPACLLQPANIVFANGRFYIGNEANKNLSPRNTQLPPTSPEWETTLRLWTISRFTPPAATGTSGRGLAISTQGNAVVLNWQAGGTAVNVLRSAGGVISNLTPSALPASTNTFTDTSAPRGLNCYALASVGASPQTFSDLECAVTGVRTGAAPQNFSLQLNQSNSARLTWSPPPGGGQDGYALLRLGGSTEVSGASVTNTTVPITGAACFVLGTIKAGEIAGNTDILCAQPGFAANLSAAAVQEAMSQATSSQVTNSIKGLTESPPTKK